VYNFTAIQCLAWAQNRKMIEGATIFEPGTPKYAPQMIQYIKSHMPQVVAAPSPKDLYKELKCKSFQWGDQWEKMNRRYDLVISCNSFDQELDPFGHFKFLWERTRTGGNIILDLPASCSSDPFGFSPNFVSYIRRYNNIDVPYMRLSDKTGQFCTIPDSNKIYSTRELNEDILFKFKETLQLRLTVCFKKNESEELNTHG